MSEPCVCSTKPAVFILLSHAMCQCGLGLSDLTRLKWMAPGPVTLREACTNTHKHKTKQMPDLLPLMPNTHTVKHTRMKSIPETDFSLCVCVCDATAPLSKTNRGNPPCLALSITGHLTVPAHVGSCRPPTPPHSSPDLHGRAPNPRDSTNTHADTHIHMHRPLGSSRVPLTQGHTQTGSWRRGLCQFASLRTLQV